MISFIKNLFGGLFAFIGRLFKFGNKPQLASGNSKGSGQQAFSQNNSSLKETATQAATQVKETASKAASSLSGTQVKETATQAATQVKETASKAAMFLTGDDARGFKSSNGKPSDKAQNATASQSAAQASALNLSKPKVTTQYGKFSNYGDRRRPGANMKSYLDMARQMKTSR